MGPWAQKVPRSSGVAKASQSGHHASANEPGVNMRPGLGLVVMALAFFSGTRTGTSQSSAPIKGKLGKFYDSSLTQINPWLSACDLAQPNTAPDLQVIKSCKLCQQQIHVVAVNTNWFFIFLTGVDFLKSNSKKISTLSNEKSILNYFFNCLTFFSCYVVHTLVAKISVFVLN